jgi:tetratricopeptide (TPR) repeat protein
MKQHLTLLFILIGIKVLAQNSPTTYPLDPRYWGVVLEHPAMKNVIVKQDVPYWKDEKGSLNIDIYLPPGLKSSELRPAVIFLNGIGENPGQAKVKSWGIYKTWPQLMAANGFIGISMETDRTRVQESMQALFKFLSEKGNSLNIDATKLGVYAASANVNQSATFLMKEDTYKGIKAAVLYYGGVPQGPYRKDLPVLFVISEGDVARNGYTNLWTEVLKNNAPWTVQMATGMPHAFDAFEDTDESRKVVKETISFWKNNLEPVEQPSWQKSLPRSILAASYGHDDVKLIPLLEQWLPEHAADVEALFQYASALKNVRRYDESEKAYRKVIALDPNNVQALTYMYLLMHTLNRSDEAEPFLARAEKIGSINKYTYVGMGYTMYGLNKHKEGVRFFEKAVEADPTGINLYNLACGYARIGEKDNAFLTLGKSVDAGFNSRQQFETDTDLESLRTDARYKVLMERVSNPGSR